MDDRYLNVLYYLLITKIIRGEEGIIKEEVKGKQGLQKLTLNRFNKENGKAYQAPPIHEPDKRTYALIAQYYRAVAENKIKELGW